MYICRKPANAIPENVIQEKESRCESPLLLSGV